MLKRKNVAILMGMALLATLSGCQEKAPQAVFVKSVQVVEPVPLAARQTKVYSGIVQEAHEVSLGFKTAGQIEEILVEEGDRVTEGQLIARLDDKDYRLGVDALEVQYDQLTQELERMKLLLDAKSVSQNDYDKAVAGWKQLGIQLQNNRNQLSYTRLESPISGYVQSVNFEPSEMVNAGTAVISLLDTHRLEVVVDIPAEVYLQRNSIKDIYCDSPASEEKDIPMRLLSITPKADGNQLYRMRLAFAGKTAGLTAGMNIEASFRIAVADSAISPAVCTLPMHAVSSDNGKSFVWVISPDSTVHKTPVTLSGMADNGDAIITSGITTDNQVVKAGVEYLQDSEKVNILPAPSGTNVGNIL